MCGNFLKDGMQSSGFGYPKGRLHDFAVSFVHVALMTSLLVSHLWSGRPLTYLPRLKHHHHLRKRQVPVKTSEHHEDLITYKLTAQTPGDLQAGDACNRRCAECGEWPSDLISRASMLALISSTVTGDGILTWSSCDCNNVDGSQHLCGVTTHLSLTPKGAFIRATPPNFSCQRNSASAAFLRSRSPRWPVGLSAMRSESEVG